MYFICIVGVYASTSYMRTMRILNLFVCRSFPYKLIHKNSYFAQKLAIHILMFVFFLILVLLSVLTLTASWSLRSRGVINYYCTAHCIEISLTPEEKTTRVFYCSNKIIKKLVKMHKFN